MRPNGHPGERHCIVCGIVGRYDEYDWRQCYTCMWWACTADCERVHEEEEDAWAEKDAEKDAA